MLKTLIEIPARQLSPEAFELAPDARVLAALLRHPGELYLACDDDPADENLGSWLHVGGRTRVVSRAVDVTALLRFLRPGNWCLYLADAPLPSDATPDTFRDNLGHVTAQLRFYSVRVFIDAWHDNTLWRVFVHEGADTGTAKPDLYK